VKRNYGNILKFNHRLMIRYLGAMKLNVTCRVQITTITM